MTTKRNGVKRPAAHNPMVYRKVAAPAGAQCGRPGCDQFVRAGSHCEQCEADQSLAMMQALGIGYPDDDSYAITGPLCCVYCAGRLGAQNPGDVCDMCKHTR